MKERLGIEDDDEMHKFTLHLAHNGLLLCQWWKLWSLEQWDDHKNQWSQEHWDIWRESLKSKSSSARCTKYILFLLPFASFVEDAMTLSRIWNVVQLDVLAFFCRLRLSKTPLTLSQIWNFV